MQKLVLMMLCLASSVAIAKDNGIGHDKGNGSPPSKPVIVSPAVSTPITVSNTSTINAINNIASNASSVSESVNDVRVNNQVTLNDKNTPSVSSYVGAPSATCIVTGGGSLSIPGFGASIGGGNVDSTCVARENARLLMSMNEIVAAKRVLCESDPIVAKYVVDCAVIHDRNQRIKPLPSPYVH
jgi:hypothetical protein